MKELEGRKERGRWWPPSRLMGRRRKELTECRVEMKALVGWKSVNGMMSSSRGELEVEEHETHMSYLGGWLKR